MLFKIDEEETNSLPYSNLKSINLSESDLVDIIINNPDILLEESSLLLLGQEVVLPSGQRIDILYLDQDGFLVIVEVKRDVDDQKHRIEDLSMQAIRYASQLKDISVEYLVTFTNIVNDIKPSTIVDFLSSFNKKYSDFNHDQRVIVIASSFYAQAIKTVEYLREKNFNIRAIRCTPVSDDTTDTIYLDVVQVIPRDTGIVRIEDQEEVIIPSEKDITKIKFIPEKVFDLRLKDLIISGYLKTPTEVKFSYKSCDYFCELKSDETVVHLREKGSIDDLNKIQKTNYISLHQWILEITGWKSVQIYPKCFVKQEGVEVSLQEIREELFTDLIEVKE